jgi:hypothetical protein
MGELTSTDYMDTKVCKFSKTALSSIGRPILYLMSDNTYGDGKRDKVAIFLDPKDEATAKWKGIQAIKFPNTQ